MRIAQHIAPWEFPEGSGSVHRIAADILRARDAVLADAGETAVDRVELELFLIRMAREARPIRAAIYEGLLARLRRGQFDEKEDR